MDLILWRHAEAEDIRHGVTDSERQLTPKGIKQAQRMAVWLGLHLPEDARVFASPAARTRQTVAALERRFDVSDMLSTGASISDHLALSRWPVDDTVLLVGHQPTLGQLAALLMSGHPQNWEIKKGAAWWLRSAAEKSGTYATLRAAILPSMLE